MNVHNHGTEDGPGLACREQLIGKCQLDALRSRCESLEAALREMVETAERMADNIQSQGAAMSEKDFGASTVVRTPRPRDSASLLSGDAKDAARYRYLRELNFNTPLGVCNADMTETYNDEELDRVVDAAMDAAMTTASRENGTAETSSGVIP